MNGTAAETSSQSRARFAALWANTRDRIAHELIVAAYQLVEQKYDGLVDTADVIARLAKDAEYQRGLAESNA